MKTEIYSGNHGICYCYVHKINLVVVRLQTHQ